MEEKRKINYKKIIYFALTIVIIIIGIVIYSKYNFYDFVKGVRESGKTSFTRDSKIKYSDEDSYKIENRDFNDSMFYKAITVQPNTAYRVTCMVKTDEVVNQEEKINGGAQICINGTTECSEAITGTTDWTKLTFMFNSNSRTEVEIGFRLGGYDEYSKGAVWFSDFSIEQGSLDSNNNWNIGCFVIDNINTTLDNGRKVELTASYDDLQTVESNMERLQDSIEVLSAGKMTVTYDIIEIKDALRSLSYDEENNYYASPTDVEPLIDTYIKNEEYDYIYVFLRLGDLHKDNNQDWIGLRFYGI